jgi:hypothetical protein
MDMIYEKEDVISVNINDVNTLNRSTEHFRHIRNLLAVLQAKTRDFLLYHTARTTIIGPIIDNTSTSNDLLTIRMTSILCSLFLDRDSSIR